MATTWRIVPLDAGDFLAFEKSRFTYQRNVGEKIQAPCLVWLLLDGPEPVLVDLGPTPPAEAERVHGWAMRREPRHDLVAQLKAHRVNPEDVETVLVTHLHWDHVANAHLFPRARIYVQRRELAYAVAPLYPQRDSYEANEPSPPWMRNWGRYVVLDGDREVVPGVTAHLLPGHTPGSQGIGVRTADGTYLIAGDNVDLFENWEGAPGVPHIPGSIFVDLEDYLRSFERMESLARFVLPSHDMRVLERPEYP